MLFILSKQKRLYHDVSNVGILDIFKSTKKRNPRTKTKTTWQPRDIFLIQLVLRSETMAIKFK